MKYFVYIVAVLKGIWWKLMVLDIDFWKR